MIFIDSSVWEIHLKAAKEVISSRKPTFLPQDPTSDFLRQEIFITNSFASTTSFTDSIQSDSYTAGSFQSTGISIEFSKLLDIVTNLERQIKEDPTLLVDSEIYSSGLRTLFENTRSRALAMSKSLQISNERQYLQISRTVNCFYHAGLIYAHRALLKIASEESDQQIAISKSQLFELLDFEATTKATLQYLVWPLFIAGTEATQDFEGILVVTKLKEAMEGTGFSNCQQALDFLTALWARRKSTTAHTEEFDWIKFARDWTNHGKRTFLVF
jgi:hypothetical protein